MSAIVVVTDRVKGQVQSLLSQVRTRMFGTNNERLDFLMDSFYKLNSNQRLGVMGGVILFICVCVMTLVFLYFTQVNQLTNDLNNSFQAMHELRTLRANYEVEDKKFDKLFSMIQRRTSDLKMKPEFEKIARNLGVTIDGVSEKKVPLDSDNPLADRVQEVHVDLRLGNISIPRLLNFVVDVEKSKKYMRIMDMQVKGRYGTKLFFDAQLKIRGYSPTR